MQREVDRIGSIQVALQRVMLKAVVQDEQVAIQLANGRHPAPIAIRVHIAVPGETNIRVNRATYCKGLEHQNEILYFI